MSSRTQALMVNTPIKAQQVALTELSEEVRATRPGFAWTLDLERARLVTESYRQTEHEPMVLRRAKALAHILEQMTLYIRPDEMIVGNYASNSDSVPFYPELAWKWIKRETAPGQVYECMLSDEGRKELEEICDYWGNFSIHHRLRNYLPEALSEVFWVFNWEASTPNYDKIFALGLKGILQQVADRKDSLEEEYLAETMTGEEYLRKRDVLDGMAIGLEAVIAWSKRYAALARDLAEKETDPTRKQELEAIAENCEWVPENPARTFQEALQCYWLVHLVINFIDLPQVGSGIRLDQSLYPFYERDLREGRISRDEAQELRGIPVREVPGDGLPARAHLVRLRRWRPGIPDRDDRRRRRTGQRRHQRALLYRAGRHQERARHRPAPGPPLARRHPRKAGGEGDRGDGLGDAPARDLQRQGEHRQAGEPGLLPGRCQELFDQQLHGAHHPGKEPEPHLGLGQRRAASALSDQRSRHSSSALQEGRRDGHRSRRRSVPSKS